MRAYAPHKYNQKYHKAAVCRELSTFYKTSEVFDLKPTRSDGCAEVIFEDGDDSGTA